MFEGTCRPISNSQRVEWMCTPNEGEPFRVALERSGGQLLIVLGEQSTATWIPPESMAALTEMFAFKI